MNVVRRTPWAFWMVWVWCLRTGNAQAEEETDFYAFMKKAIDTTAADLAKDYRQTYLEGAAGAAGITTSNLQDLYVTDLDSNKLPEEFTLYTADGKTVISVNNVLKEMLKFYGKSLMQKLDGKLLMNVPKEHETRTRQTAPTTTTTTTTTATTTTTTEQEEQEEQEVDCSIAIEKAVTDAVLKETGECTTRVNKAVTDLQTLVAEASAKDVASCNDRSAKTVNEVILREIDNCRTSTAIAIETMQNEHKVATEEVATSIKSRTQKECSNSIEDAVINEQNRGEDAARKARIECAERVSTAATTASQEAVAAGLRNRLAIEQRPCKPTACTPTACSPTPCSPTPCSPTPCSPTPCSPTPCTDTRSKPLPCAPRPCTPRPRESGPSTEQSSEKPATLQLTSLRSSSTITTPPTKPSTITSPTSTTSTPSTAVQLSTTTTRDPVRYTDCSKCPNCLLRHPGRVVKSIVENIRRLGAKINEQSTSLKSGAVTEAVTQEIQNTLKALFYEESINVDATNYNLQETKNLLEAFKEEFADRKDSIQWKIEETVTEQVVDLMLFVKWITAGLTGIAAFLGSLFCRCQYKKNAKKRRAKKLLKNSTPIKTMDCSEQETRDPFITEMSSISSNTNKGKSVIIPVQCPEPPVHTKIEESSVVFSTFASQAKAAPVPESIEMRDMRLNDSFIKNVPYPISTLYKDRRDARQEQGQGQERQDRRQERGRQEQERQEHRRAARETVRTDAQEFIERSVGRERDQEQAQHGLKNIQCFRNEEDSGFVGILRERHPSNKNS